ncbi:leucine rich repeat [Seminavis robusta]|uniref:Leucine rich repeat n=1 Tax=Seminavis robusta TaxID=568900 RepID=A0A9N8HMF5_9STRA|nr:leucine rich repeat [Seminavis robusta]|eukprot:Sro995_g229140.1 leucine rich repeat (970) ;mRNA; f:9151-12060
MDREEQEDASRNADNGNSERPTRRDARRRGPRVPRYTGPRPGTNNSNSPNRSLSPQQQTQEEHQQEQQQQQQQESVAPLPQPTTRAEREQEKASATSSSINARDQRQRSQRIPENVPRDTPRDTPDTPAPNGSEEGSRSLSTGNSDLPQPPPQPSRRRSSASTSTDTPTPNANGSGTTAEGSRRRTSNKPRRATMEPPMTTTTSNHSLGGSGSMPFDISDHSTSSRRHPPPSPRSPFRATAPAGGGIFTIDQMMELGFDAPAPLPLPAARPPPPPAVPGAFRGAGPGVDQQPEPIRPLYKGGIHVLGRESTNTNKRDDSDHSHGMGMSRRESSLYFDNEPRRPPPRPSFPRRQTEPHMTQRQRDEQQECPPLQTSRTSTTRTAIEPPDVEEARPAQRPTPILPDTSTPVLVPSIRDVFVDHQEHHEQAPHDNNNHANPDKSDNTKSVWIISAVVCVILVIVIGVAAGVSSNNHNDDGSSSNATDASSGFYAVSLDQMFPLDSTSLPNHTRQAILSENEQSPQVQAFQWLSQDENWDKYGMPQRQQRFALATLYYATGGPKWFDHVLDDNNNKPSPWLDYSTHECSWYDLPNFHGRQKCFNYTTATAADTMANPWDAHFDYQSILLSADPRLITTNNNRVRARARGTLVPELALLTNLQELDMDYQNLKGTIPNELTQLSNTLQFIYFTKCFFTGTIPADLFVSSRSLFLSHNYRLNASIPTTIGNPSSRMSHLLLTEANLQGTIPSEIGLATGLQELLLNGNDLQGTIPSEVGRLSRLKVLDFTDNELSGTIPSEIGQARQLQDLKLGANFDMAGTLPTSLALLSDLRVLDVYKNSIEGSLQPELFFATNTKNDNNSTTTTSTAMAASWPRLHTLMLTENGLSGPLPSEIGLLGGSLTDLFLARNRFDSQLPTELGLLSGLVCLSIAQNHFSGQFPPVAMGAGLITDVDADLSSSSELRVSFDEHCGPH